MSAKAAQIDVWRRNVWAMALDRPVLCLLAFTLVMVLPGLVSVPPIDRDESRFAQATVQMIERDDFVEVWFQDAPRNKKPAGIHWLQALSVTAFSELQNREIWAYRLPSLIAAVLAVLLTYWGGLALFGKRVALLGALMLAGGLLFTTQASIATTDAALLACVAAGQFALGKIYLGAMMGRDARHFTSPGSLALIFWIAMGLGLLIKGPIAPLIAVLTILSLGILDRHWSWLRRLSPLPGFVLLIAITAPWATAIWDATNGAFFYDALSIEIWGKFTEAQELHSGPPGYHAALLPVLLWPASLFLLPALLMAWRQRTRLEIKFCLAWIIPAWLVFELTTTKLPHYLLPVFPALCLLVSWALFEAGESTKSMCGFFKTKLARVWIAVWSALAVLVACAPLVAQSLYSDGPTLIALGLSLIILILAFSTAQQVLSDRPVLAAGSSLAAAAVAALLWFEATLPNLHHLNLTPRISALIEKYDPERTQIVSLLGYSEPSIVFILGTSTILAKPDAAADHMAATPGALALVDDKNRFEFFDEISRLGLSVDEIESLEGFNYSNGKSLKLTLYRTTE